MLRESLPGHRPMSRYDWMPIMERQREQHRPSMPYPTAVRISGDAVNRRPRRRASIRPSCFSEAVAPVFRRGKLLRVFLFAGHGCCRERRAPAACTEKP